MGCSPCTQEVEDGRTAPGVCGNGSVPLKYSGNVVTGIGIHTHTHTHTFDKVLYIALREIQCAISSNFPT